MCSEIIRLFFKGATGLLKDLEEGAATGDHEMLHRASHALKSASANIGARLAVLAMQRARSIGELGACAERRRAGRSHPGRVRHGRRQSLDAFAARGMTADRGAPAQIRLRARFPICCPPHGRGETGSPGVRRRANQRGNSATGAADAFLTELRVAKALAARLHPTPQKGGNEGLSMNNQYLEVISLVERLHRQFLEVVKLELDGIGIHDINNVQAMMLFNIGDAEMTVGELTLRGCYLGSNVSYNVKKMVENGYLAHERSVHDRRSIHVRLTERGIKLRDSLTVMHQRHGEMLTQTALSSEDLQATGVTLRRLERFWIRAADLAQRPTPQFSSALPAHQPGAAPTRAAGISAR